MFRQRAEGAGGAPSTRGLWHGARGARVLRSDRSSRDAVKTVHSDFENRWARGSIASGVTDGRDAAGLPEAGFSYCSAERWSAPTTRSPATPLPPMPRAPSPDLPKIEEAARDNGCRSRSLPGSSGSKAISRRTHSAPQERKGLRNSFRRPRGMRASPVPSTGSGEWEGDDALAQLGGEIPKSRSRRRRL
jgi:hypothetical protein